MKKPLHSFGQRLPECTPIFGLSLKNFLRKFPLTYSHGERSNAHPKSQKNFYPFTYLELSAQNAPYFSEKIRGKFFNEKALSLVPTGRGLLGTVFLKKSKKIARQLWRALTSVKNKQFLLKYSRFCDMIFLDYCRR